MPLQLSLSAWEPTEGDPGRTGSPWCWRPSLKPAWELAPGRPLTTGHPLLSVLSRVPLVFKDPLALLGRKESEEPEVNPDLPACLDPLASV